MMDVNWQVLINTIISVFPGSQGCPQTVGLLGDVLTHQTKPGKASSTPSLHSRLWLFLSKFPLSVSVPHSLAHSQKCTASAAVFEGVQDCPRRGWSKEGGTGLHILREVTELHFLKNKRKNRSAGNQTWVLCKISAHSIHLPSPRNLASKGRNLKSWAKLVSHIPFLQDALGDYLTVGFLMHPTIILSSLILGIYLLDLIYIDSAYPASGSIMENEQRSNQMNNILRIIADLQVSCSYDHLTTLPHVQKYLKSVRYIEELQKFVEDDNYKLSLRIEPGSSSPRLVSSKEDLAGPSAGSSSARFRRRPTCPDASVAGSLPTPPVPRHRKSHSLGNNMMCQLSVVESKSATFPSEKARHLLDDSVLESRSPRRGPSLTSSTAVTNGLSLGSSESSEFSEEMSAGLESRGRLYATLGPNWRVPVRNSPRTRSCVYSPTSPCTCTVGSSATVPTMEGPLRRKTLLKEGRKPALSSWTRYWVVLSGSTLLYYGAKSLRGTDRKHYKSTPGKKVSIIGWMVQLPDDPEHPDIFQLNNPDKGNVYKFQTGSRFHAILWHKHLDDACKSNRPQSRNILHSFE
ncbi:Ralgps1 [Phodopus roborovskii]|uniref:Ralgps1 protein n=1 Tax=Phodopus roborovskii TaxID=109678 RepID=A0AAU9Z9R0_PHORO|nr:Ralgps1 [Phodopus roborovskii]